jgi:hypothetical protein
MRYVTDQCGYILKIAGQYYFVRSTDFWYITSKRPFRQEYRRTDIFDDEFKPEKLSEEELKPISFHCNHPFKDSNFVISNTVTSPKDLVAQIKDFAEENQADKYRASKETDVFISRSGNIYYMLELDNEYRKAFNGRRPRLYINFSKKTPEYLSITQRRRGENLIHPLEKIILTPLLTEYGNLLL